MVNDGNPTYIHNHNGTLTFDAVDDQGNSLPLASKEDYQLADRCVGSIFEALEPNESVKLSDGYFNLDDELDLIQDWSIV